MRAGLHHLEERVPGGDGSDPRRHRPPLRERAAARHRRVQPLLRVDLQRRRTPARTSCRGSGSRARGARRCSSISSATRTSTDVLIFFTYLYAPTVLGARIAPHKTILVPTAHDEPAIHLGIYKEVFSAPAGIAYNTDVERRFLTTHFSIRRGRGRDRRLRRRPAAARRNTRRIRRPTASPIPTRKRRCRTTSSRPAGARTWRRAACSSSGGTGCTGRSRSTAAASIPARAARS